MVDDNRLLVSRFFHQLKHIVLDTAENGQECLKKVQSSSYDVVLMDMRMPIMNGAETTQKIRDLDGRKFKQLPIIALTADTYGIPKDIGFTDILTKPFKFTDLTEIIEKYGINEA